MKPKTTALTFCVWGLLISRVFGFSSDGSLLTRSFDKTTTPINTPVVTTVTFTNGGTAIVRGFCYSDQVPSGLTVTTLGVMLEGRVITNYIFEAGGDSDVYAGCTPYRWVLEGPLAQTETNPIPPRAGVQIIYTISSSTPGVFNLQQFSWAAYDPDSTNALFGCSENADQQPLTFLTSPPPAYPILAIGAMTIDFNTTERLIPPGQVLGITNNGGGILNWMAAADGSAPAWLTVSPTNGAGNSAVSVAVASTSLAPGVYSKHLTVTAAEATNSPQTVIVNLTVTPANEPPVANNDNYSVAAGATLTVSAPGVLGNDTDPDGDPLVAAGVSGPWHGTLTLSPDGSFTYTPTNNYIGPDNFTYKASDGQLNSAPATVGLAITPVSGALFTDDFTRSTNPAPLTPWVVRSNNWAVNNGVLQGGVDPPASYGIVYLTNSWANYAVEGRFRFPGVTAYGAGLGGRLDRITGTRYAAWIYPTDNVLNLVKFKGWESASYPGDFLVRLLPLPAIGTNWHTLKLAFLGNQIAVYYDGSLATRLTDSANPYSSGGVSLDMYTGATPYVMSMDDITVKPLAMDDSYSIGENTTLTLLAPGVLSNDTGVYGTNLTTVLVSGPTNGWLALTNNGGFRYTPSNNYVGPDSFTYLAKDGSTNLGTANVNIIIVTPVNSLPVANNDSYSMAAGTTLTVNAPGVLSNDTDPNGDPLTALGVTGPLHGTLALNLNGSFTYSPTNNYSGPDSFTYCANDGQSNSVPATVSITITTVNLRPVANNDSYNVTAGATLTVNAPGVLSNDTDPNGDPLTALGVTGPLHGTLALNLNGSFTYSPTNNYSGPDSFTYSANDGQSNSVPATVSITITPVNLRPVANNDSYNVTAGTTLTVNAPGVLSNDTDPNGDSLTALGVTGPLHGTLALNLNGSFTYSPTNNYSGPDSFTYCANDGQSNSVPAIVSITVTPVTGTLFADDFTRGTEPGSLSPWLLNSGTWTITGGMLRGTSAAQHYGYVYLGANWTNYSVQARVEFPAGTFGGGIGGRLASATGAHYGAWIYPEGSSGGSSVLRLVKFRGWTSWSYTPMQLVNLPGVGTNWHKLKLTFRGNLIQVSYDDAKMIEVLDDAFDAQASYSSGGISLDMAAAATAASTMNVDDVIVSAPVNEPPVANNDSYNSAVGTTLIVSAPGVLGNDTDADGNALTAVGVSGPIHGTLALNTNGGFTYIPTNNYSGPDSFTYQANDGQTNSALATVSITVTAANSLLFTDDFTRSTSPGPLSPWVVRSNLWTITAGVLQGGTDPLNTYGVIYLTNSWSACAVQARFQFPSVTAYGAGLGVRLNPATGTRYAAWIYPVNNVLNLVKFRAWENASYPTDFLVRQLPLPTIGTNWHTLKLALLNNQIAVYYDGNLVTRVTDSASPYASGGVSLDMYTGTTPYVISMDDVLVKPLAMDDYYTVSQNASLTVNAPGVLGNDTGINGTNLSAVLVSGPANGTLSLTNNGGFTYTPSTNYSGPDAFTYQLNDGVTNLGTATVTISVTPAGPTQQAVTRAQNVPSKPLQSFLVLTPPGTSMEIQSLRVSPEGQVHLTLQALAGQRFVIQASTNLDSWEDIGTIDFPGTPVEFVDTEAVLHSHRFYRTKRSD